LRRRFPENFVAEEGLLATNRSFAALLKTKSLRHEFHTASGGHTWIQWETWLDACFESLREHMQRGNGHSRLPVCGGFMSQDCVFAATDFLPARAYK
jgi:hypothetical protein